MFMTKEEVLKKLEAAKRKAVPAIEKEIARLEKVVRENGGEECAVYWAKKLKSCRSRIKGFRSVPGMPYRPRSGEFYTKQSGFDPETGRAHSYHWYDLGRVIDGQYVVNSYGYSMQTRGHYYDLVATLKVLGVPFVELEAPRGLQNLGASHAYYLGRIAGFQVAIKYGSKKSAAWRNRAIKDCEKSLELLARFGVKTTSGMRKIALDGAENDRANRLLRDARDRETAAIRAFERAVSTGDVRGIVKFHNLNARRLKKGLPELKSAA